MTPERTLLCQDTSHRECLISRQGCPLPAEGAPGLSSQPRPRETFYGLERLGSCLSPCTAGREGSQGTDVSMVAWTPQGDARGVPSSWLILLLVNQGWEINVNDQCSLEGLAAFCLQGSGQSSPGYTCGDVLGYIPRPPCCIYVTPWLAQAAPSKPSVSSFQQQQRFTSLPDTMLSEGAPRARSACNSYRATQEGRERQGRGQWQRGDLRARQGPVPIPQLLVMQASSPVDRDASTTGIPEAPWMGRIPGNSLTTASETPRLWDGEAYTLHVTDCQGQSPTRTCLSTPNFAMGILEAASNPHTHSRKAMALPAASRSLRHGHHEHEVVLDRPNCRP